MTTFSRQALLDFLDLYGDYDSVDLRTVRELFGEAEDKYIRMTLLSWMWTRPDQLTKSSVLHLLKEADTMLTTPERDIPVAAQETIAERIAKIKARQAAYVPDVVSQKCENCLNTFEQPRKIFMHVVCQDCRDGWRTRYVTGNRPSE